MLTKRRESVINIYIDSADGPPSLGATKNEGANKMIKKLYLYLTNRPAYCALCALERLEKSKATGKRHNRSIKNARYVYNSLLTIGGKNDPHK